jgi:hypothetical protein
MVNAQERGCPLRNATGRSWVLLSSVLGPLVARACTSVQYRFQQKRPAPNPKTSGGICWGEADVFVKVTLLIARPRCPCSFSIFNLAT